MELYQLRYFYYAAEYENLSEASRQLMVAQSSISKAIAGLEAELHTQLFTRSGKKITLNSNGALLRSRVAPILSAVDALPFCFQNSEGLPTIRLRVLCASALIPDILEAYNGLAAENDVIVIEGAGSPAEINLRTDDIVNMGMARLAKAPVLLVGDIDRGGVFAQLYGTIALLTEEERALVRATVINKFRGDVSLLKNGISMLESLTGKPVAGVLPMLAVDIEDEDSLSSRFSRKKADSVLDIAVIRLPRISNFTDFAALEATPGVGVRYVDWVDSLGTPDLVILPGTKSTISDLQWLRQSGLEAAVKKCAASGVAIMGICGGYQMLGLRISDPSGVEGGGEISGLGLLPVETEFVSEKHRTRMRGTVLQAGGVLAPLSGAELEGYEIHMGRTERANGAKPLVRLENGLLDGCQQGNVYGSYLHGFFDTEACRQAVLGALAAQKGVSLTADVPDRRAYKESQYDLLAKAVRENLDMQRIYRILEEGVS